MLEKTNSSLLRFLARQFSELNWDVKATIPTLPFKKKGRRATPPLPDLQWVAVMFWGLTNCAHHSGTAGSRRHKRGTLLSSALHFPAKLSSYATDRAATRSSSGYLRAGLSTSPLPASFSMQAVVHTPLRIAAAPCATGSASLAFVQWIV